MSDRPKEALDEVARIAQVHGDYDDHPALSEAGGKPLTVEDIHFAMWELEAKPHSFGLCVPLAVEADDE